MKVSVCMAVYNGEKYIKEQLDSILVQLGHNDEIIAVNDSSWDNSVNIIKNFQDSRIQLINNEKNLGVLKTFEKALNNSSGEIIFLSDQDDIWLPEKVEKFLNIFQTCPDVTLVLSDAQIIDGEGNISSDSFFDIRGKFIANPVSNLIKNKYHGCTIAFRHEMLKFLLPFPKDTPMHDIWIGIVNGIYGKAFYINETLIQHRRHENNASRGPLNSAGIIKIIKWRFALVKNIINVMLKHGLLKF